MLNNLEQKQLNRIIRVAVTRGVFQGVICLALFAVLLVAAWGLFQGWLIAGVR